MHDERLQDAALLDVRPRALQASPRETRCAGCSHPRRASTQPRASVCRRDRRAWLTRKGSRPSRASRRLLAAPSLRADAARSSLALRRADRAEPPSTCSTACACADRAAAFRREEVPVKTCVVACRRPAWIQLHPGRPSTSRCRHASFQISLTRPSLVARDGYQVRATDCQRLAAAGQGRRLNGSRCRNPPLVVRPGVRPLYIQSCRTPPRARGTGPWVVVGALPASASTGIGRQVPTLS